MWFKDLCLHKSQGYPCIDYALCYMSPIPTSLTNWLYSDLSPVLTEHDGVQCLAWSRPSLCRFGVCWHWFTASLSTPTPATISDACKMHKAPHLPKSCFTYFHTLSSISGAYIYDLPTCTSGFPWWLSSKERACQCRRRGLDPWVRKIPWRRKWQPTPLFLCGKSHAQRTLEGYSPWDRKRVRHNLATKQQRTTSTSKILTLKNHPSDLNVYPFPSSILHKLHPNDQALKSCPISILTLSQASLTSQRKDHHI